MTKTATYEEMLRALENVDAEPERTFLSGLKSNDEYVVWAAIKGCGLKRIISSVPELINFLTRRSKDLGGTDHRRIAAWALGQIGFYAFAPYLGQVESNPNQLFREGISDALGMAKDPRGLPILGKLLGDSEANVVLWASLALSKFGDDAVPFVEACLDTKPDLPTTVYALDALRKINTPRARAVMARIFRDTSYEELQQHRDALER